MKAMKKFLALALAAAMLLSLSGCGGFELKMARAAGKMSKLESVHMDMDLQLDMSMPTFLGKSLPIDVAVSGGVDSSFGPLLTKAQLRVSALGAEKDLLYYLEQAGEQYVMYLSSNEGKTWVKELVEAEELPGQLNLDMEDLMIFKDCADSFTEVGTETVGEFSATRYDGVIQSEYVSRALALTGALDTLSQALGIPLDGEELGQMGSIPASVWIDNKSGYIVRYTMEPTEVMQGVISMAMAGLLADYGLGDLDPELKLERATVTMDLSGFNAVPEIVIPAGAKAA